MLAEFLLCSVLGQSGELTVRDISSEMRRQTVDDARFECRYIVDWRTNGKPWSPERPSVGVFQVQPSWFGYNYEQVDHAFDLTEQSPFVRWNGRDVLKYSLSKQTYRLNKSVSPTLRLQWNDHFLFTTALLINFCSALERSGPSLDFLLPNALERGRYKVIGKRQLDGLSLCGVRDERGDEIWFSPEHGWNVVHRRWPVPGNPNPSIEFRCHDFQKVGSRWLPTRCEMKSYDSNGSPIVRRTRFLDYKIMPAKEFLPEPPPGSLWEVSESKVTRRQVFPGGPDLFGDLVTRLRHRGIADSLSSHWILLAWLTAFIPYCWLGFRVGHGRTFSLPTLRQRRSVPPLSG